MRNRPFPPQKRTNAFRSKRTFQFDLNRLERISHGRFVTDEQFEYESFLNAINESEHFKQFPSWCDKLCEYRRIKETKEINELKFKLAQ
jgi:hypothetical protein